MSMFCTNNVTFLHYLLEYKTEGLFPSSEITGGKTTPPRFMFLKYCENVIAAQNIVI